MIRPVPPRRGLYLPGSASSTGEFRVPDARGRTFSAETGGVSGRLRTRRGALGLMGLAGLALAGCGNSGTESLAEQANASSDQGYISGEGVITQLAKSERGEPLDVSFTTLTGEETSLAEWRPKVVAINLWYAACPPCRVEAPHLNEVYEEFAGEVEFLGANVRDEAPTAESFVRTFEVPYPNMIDSRGEIVSLLSSILPPQATPSTVILDPEGRAAGRVVGATTASTLRGLIEDAGA